MGAWSALPPSTIVDVAAKNAAAKAAAAAEATPEGEEPPPAPEPITDPVEAAKVLLEDESVVGAVTGAADAAEGFSAACAALGVTSSAHPAVLKGLEKGGAFSLRGWQADLPSLCALLAVLSKQGSVTAAKFWSCGFDAMGLSLLTSSLPETIETLALEGAPLADEAALASLASLPKVSSLSLRCAGLGGVPAPLAAALGANETLTSLSLFGNPIGDDGAAALCASLRANTTLLTLDLGRTGLTDASCERLLEMCTEEPAPPPAADGDAGADGAAVPSSKDDGGGQAEDGGELEAAAPAPVPPNRSLSSLSLAYNAIRTRGRGLLEQCQQLSPGLARVELVGNPCLSCGPTASLGVAARAAIRDSWTALAALEGGAEGACAALVTEALARVPDVLPIVGYEPPPTPRPETDEEGNPIEAPEGGEAAAAEGGEEGGATSKIGAWAGLAPLSAKVCAAIGGLVDRLGDPEALRAALAGDYGVLLASRGVPAGAPFEAFGEVLLAQLQASLGEQLSEEGAAAWKDAYADAAACMQEAYTLSQLAEAAAKAAAAAAPAEADAAEA